MLPTPRQETAERRPAALNGRWQEPVITDYRAFVEAHPETVVTPELWERLDPEIRRRASLLEYDATPDVQADLRAELRARIIEAATGYRSVDANGEPIFDYLSQHPRYIVWHAAGRVYSGLRKARREQKVTDRIELLGGRDEWGEPMPADVVDTSTGSPTEAMEHAELVTAISERLFPAQRRVLELLEQGLDRGEIGEALGLSRKTIHDHVNAIRVATMEALEDDTAGLAVAAGRRAVRRPSRRATLPLRPVSVPVTRTAARSPRAALQRAGSARPARTR